MIEYFEMLGNEGRIILFLMGLLLYWLVCYILIRLFGECIFRFPYACVYTPRELVPRRTLGLMLIIAIISLGIWVLIIFIQNIVIPGIKQL